MDDERFFAESLREWLNRQNICEVAGCATNGEDAWKLCRSSSPDLVLLDLDLSGECGVDLGIKLLKGVPSVRLLAMSGCTDPHTIWRVWRAGIHGYLEKTLGLDIMVPAILEVAGGGTHFSSTFLSTKDELAANDSAFYKILSLREQAILRRMALGNADEAIADLLAISAFTVGTHRKNIRRKLGLHSDRELMAYAKEWGLDRLPPASLPC